MSEHDIREASVLVPETVSPATRSRSPGGPFRPPAPKGGIPRPAPRPPQVPPSQQWSRDRPGTVRIETARPPPTSARRQCQRRGGGREPSRARSIDGLRDTHGTANPGRSPLGGPGSEVSRPHWQPLSEELRGGEPSRHAAGAGGGRRERRHPGANARRIQKRIKDLEVRDATAVRQPLAGAGWTIEECPADNRISITFDAIPAQAIRPRLKAAGFRWSPTRSAWVRQPSNRLLGGGHVRDGGSALKAATRSPTWQESPPGARLVMVRRASATGTSLADSGAVSASPRSICWSAGHASLESQRWRRPGSVCSGSPAPRRSVSTGSYRRSQVHVFGFQLAAVSPLPR
jgi:hypothetical protein